MNRLSGDKFICCPWVLLFLKRGSGGEYNNDDPTAHESLEPSEQNAASITPLGLLGICSYLRLLVLLMLLWPYLLAFESWRIAL